MMVALTNFLNIFLKVYWGPIAQSAKIVYEWSDNTIFVLINLGTAAAFLSALAGCYLVDRKGKDLRKYSIGHLKLCQQSSLPWIDMNLLKGNRSLRDVSALCLPPF